MLGLYEWLCRNVIWLYDLFSSSNYDVKVVFIDDKTVARSNSSEHVPDGEASSEKQRGH